MKVILKQVECSGVMHDVYIKLHIEVEANITREDTNWIGMVDHVAQQLALAGMERVKTSNGAGTREIKRKTGANGQHPLDPFLWPNHNCPQCKSELGLYRIKEFAKGPHKGEPGWRSVHLDKALETKDCRPIFLADKEYTIDDKTNQL